MNTEDILKLVNAGFTKADILALSKPEKAPEKPAAEPKPEPKPEPPKAEEKASPDYQPVLDAIDRLTKSIQDSNILNSTISVSEQNADDILADIIAPRSRK